MREHQRQAEEYTRSLLEAASRAEEYARSLEQQLGKYRQVEKYTKNLELELEKYRVEYARLTEAYYQHEKEARQYVESLLQALHPSKQS